MAYVCVCVCMNHTRRTTFFIFIFCLFAFVIAFVRSMCRISSFPSIWFSQSISSSLSIHSLLLFPLDFPNAPYFTLTSSAYFLSHYLLIFCTIQFSVCSHFPPLSISHSHSLSLNHPPPFPVLLYFSILYGRHISPYFQIFPYVWFDGLFSYSIDECNRTKCSGVFFQMCMSDDENGKNRIDVNKVDRKSISFDDEKHFASVLLHSGATNVIG